MAYIPALRFDFLTRLYDPLLRATLPEDAFRARLLDAAEPLDGASVLDVGCGTGTLAILAVGRGARVAGLDGDARALGIARAKTTAAGVNVDLREGLAWEPPWATATFDRVFSSLMLHHLTTEEKLATLRACHRLLKPGGRMLVADWGRPHDVWMRAAFLSVQAFDGVATTSDNVAGRLPVMMAEAGFAGVRELDRVRTVFGTLSYYEARP